MAKSAKRKYSPRAGKDVKNEMHRVRNPSEHLSAIPRIRNQSCWSALRSTCGLGVRHG
jgi:hypothetical protein